MAFTVEDGTGLSNANSMLSLADATSYHADRGNTLWADAAYSDDNKQAALIRASEYLTYAISWAGFKVNGRSQTMAWPRSDVVDRDGRSVSHTSVPMEIEYAVAEIAIKELEDPRSMEPIVDFTEVVKREKLGPLENEFFSPARNANAHKPVLTRVNSLIADYVGRGLKGNTSSLSGTSVRI